MASQQRTVDFILDQIAEAGAVHAKKMFGEYGLFCDEKMVAAPYSFVQVTATHPVPMIRSMCAV